MNKNIFYINAKAPLMIEVYPNTDQDIKNDQIDATRFEGMMFTTQTIKCFVTIAAFKLSKETAIVVNFTDDGVLYGIHYYIEKLGDE